jgi:PleD family two-component response regulator
VPAAALGDRATTASDPPVMGWRDFHSELQRAAAAAVQTGAPLSLLMADLVGPGEPSGSGGGAEPVGALAGLIRAAIGECCVLARYTERQLAIIMIETDLCAALAGAERIGRGVSSRRCGPAGAADLEASLAIGIAQFKDDEPLGHLIQRASDALGQARAEGGPAVVVDRGVKARPGRAGCGHRPAPVPMRSATAGCSAESAA